MSAVESMGLVILGVLFLAGMIVLPFVLIRIAFAFLESAINRAADRIVAAIQAGPSNPQAAAPQPAPAPTPAGRPAQTSGFRAAGPAVKLPPRPLPEPPEDDERAKLRRRMNGW